MWHFSMDPLDMDTPVLADYRKFTLINCVNTGCHKWWTTGMEGKIETKNSTLSALIDGHVEK